MIYSRETKMDPKGFIVKSFKTHIILNARFVKIIKYKVFYQQILIFYKDPVNKKIYQRYVTRNYFDEKSGTPRELCTFIVQYKNILAYRRLREISTRYLRMFSSFK